MIISREMGERGQVVIPKDIREHLGLKKGSKVLFEVEEDKVTIKPENSEKLLDEFLNVKNKLKRSMTVEEMKKIFEESYDLP